MPLRTCILRSHDGVFLLKIIATCMRTLLSRGSALTHALLKTGSISKFGRDAGLQEHNLVHWNAVDPIHQIQGNCPFFVHCSWPFVTLVSRAREYRACSCRYDPTWKALQSRCHPLADTNPFVCAMKKRSFGVLSMSKPRNKKCLLSYTSLFLCGVLLCFYRRSAMCRYGST